MAKAEEKEHRRQELLKLYFEFFKHFTTLSAAAAVVLLAIYREVAAERLLLVYSLGSFGMAVLVAALGMVAALGQFRRGEEVGPATRVLVVLVATLFCAGLMNFIVHVLVLSNWLQIVLIGILLVAIASLIFFFYRGRMSRH